MLAKMKMVRDKMLLERTQVLGLLLIAALALLAPGAASAGTVYVDAASTSEEPDGSQSDPFPTIQSGINNANFHGHSRVEVAAGLYHESIMMADGVDVIGAGADVTGALGCRRSRPRSRSPESSTSRIWSGERSVDTRATMLRNQSGPAPSTGSVSHSDETATGDTPARAIESSPARRCSSRSPILLPRPMYPSTGRILPAPGRLPPASG